MRLTIPVIDLFAGPGGLSEGFAAYTTDHNSLPFKITLSIEKDYYAHQTLELRAFYREFDIGEVPEEYYQFLRGEISLDELYSKYPFQSERASNQAWRTELGITSPKIVDQRIKKALNNSKAWILIGGPPCQAYSFVGRSRMAKVWKEHPERKEQDNRHFL